MIRANMARRTATATEKANALAIYETDGPTVASERTGFGKSTITEWAKAGNVRTVRNETTAAATEAIVVDRAHVREQLRTKLLSKAEEMLDRMDDEHIDFKGKDATQVTYPKPSASGCQAYATAFAILLDKFRLELGEATARQEVHHTADVDSQIESLAREMADA